MAITDTLAGLVENPQDTVAGIVSGRGPVSAGIFGYFAGALSLLAALEMAGGGYSLPGVLFLLAAVFMVQSAGGFVTASIVHSFMDAYGRKGSSSGLFILFGISDLAWTLLVPGVIIAGAAGNWKWGLLFFVLAGAVNIYARAAAVRRSYNAGRVESLLAVCAPYLIACAGLAAFFIFGLAWIIMSLF